MKTLLILLLLLTNGALASNPKTNKADEYLQESIALSEHFKEFTIQQKGGSNWRSVGDGGCQYSSIQAAIDDYTQSSLGLLGIPVEFRIATNKIYFENLVIDGIYDISLTSGYSDCSNMAGAPGNSQSIINANNNGTVVTIQGAVQRTIEIKNIRMINGQTSGAGGGLLANSPNVALLLDNVDIRSSDADFGGGIAIVGGNTDLIMKESRVLGNLANYGGGIYCSGGSSSVNVVNHSGITGNIANGATATFPNGRGGGAFIDGCYFAVFTGSPNNSSLTGMSANSSTGHGGAIHAKNAIIRLHGHQSCGSQGCLGDDTNPVSFRSNQSGIGFSGAVLFTQNSDVKMNATWIEGNSGGSIIDTSGDDFILERFSQPCWSNVNCNFIENNSGKVIRSSYFDNFSVSNTTFKNNLDGVLNLYNPTAIRKPANIESNVFFQNGSSPIATGNQDETVFRIFGGIEVSFIHNTIIDNNSPDSIIDIDWSVFDEDVGPIFEAHSNIIINPAANSLISHSFFSSDNGFNTIDVNISALITDDTNSIAESNGVFNDAINIAGGDFISETIPGEILFVDRANGDLHLSANSRAIDYFNTPSRATVTYKDSDFEDRGFDDPNNQSPISGLFHYDLGADEKIPKPELMFANGFE